MNFHQKFFRIYQKGAREMCGDCKDFIEKKGKILDIGCGSGIVAQEFKNFFEAEIVGVDIQDKRLTDIPFKLMNGEDIPFTENSFDIVLISYVLHHCEKPIVLLKEAKRVSRGKIIIYEDIPKNLLSKFFCFIHNLTFNLFFQSRNEKETAIGNFKKREEWKQIFNNLGLRVIFEKKVSPSFSWLYPVKKALFILEKN